MSLVAIAALHAEEEPFEPQDLLNGLIQNNPKIQAARSRFEAASKRILSPMERAIKTANSLPDPVRLDPADGVVVVAVQGPLAEFSGFI